MPRRILDLSVEFKDRTSGIKRPYGQSLLGALAYHGLDIYGASDKPALQKASGDGSWRGRYSLAEIVDYCEGDVDALTRLLPAMISYIDLPRALLRGRYAGPALSAMESSGIPIDTERLSLLRKYWPLIRLWLVEEIDKDYGLYENGHFKFDRWAAFLQKHNISWLFTATGRPSIRDDELKQAAKAYPILSPIRELRHALSEMQLEDLAVGADGFNRTPLWAFGSKTGRNQPSNTKYIFGPSVWLRGLIKPPKGMSVAYVDWVAQEVAVAAATFGDKAMMDSYRRGDPHLEFGKKAGLIPPDATKKTHAQWREILKTCVFGTFYGMGEQTLAFRIGKDRFEARRIIEAHQEEYPVFWAGLKGAVDYALLTGSLHTRYGWHVHVDRDTNPRSLQNYLMQANGAEMMRIASCLATEQGLSICPIHDAFLLTAPTEHIERDIAILRKCMAEAGRAVLDGFEVRTSVERVDYPNRFMDEKRGRVMWDRVNKLLAQCQQSDVEREMAA
jgi:hypothetical protein